MTVDSTVGKVLALAAAWVTVGASVTATGQERGPSSRPAPQPAQVPFDQQAWPGRYPGATTPICDRVDQDANALIP